MGLDKINYSQQEAATLVGISVFTMIRDVKLGRVRAVRYGRRILIPREEVVRLATQGMSAITAPQVEIAA